MLTRWIALTAAFAALFPATAAGNWPQFRGPGGDGHSSSTKLPLTWSETENVKWKTPIHDRGWSSPVVWGGQIWLTTASEDGRQLYAVCVDAASGKIVHDLKLFEVENPQFAHKFNSYASPTPVIEEGRVYVTFGSPGTACLDTKTGKVLWQRRDLECNHFRGAGSSPILHGDLLITAHDGSDLQYIVALDKRTGKTVWKTNRSVDFQDLEADGKPKAEGDFRKAFATPHVTTWNGKPLLLSSGAKAHYAYDPATGKELWRVEELGQHSASTRPAVWKDLVFFPTGFAQGQLLAVKLGGAGVLDASRIAWRSNRSVPNKPSVTVVGDLLFTVDDSGIASCLMAATGEEVWRERAGGNYSASPLYADGRVYVFNEEGKAVVFAAAREFRKLAENTLADGFMASPAVHGDALILRTKSALYRIGG
jgi:outer membrane protein assembly factor BamB